MKNILNYKILCSLTAMLMFFGFTVHAQQNDNCLGAIPVVCGQSVSGSTSNATVDNVGFCGTSNTAPGVWYQVIATGSSLTIETCGSGYDTKLSVFTGSCNALSCVGGNDDACGLQSRVQVASTPGQIYYVLVHGFFNSTGSFTLTTSCPAPVPNDACASATPISCGQTVSGSTTTATADNAGFCGTSNTANGVWYQAIGNGQLFIANTCNNTNYDSKISVFSGNCGALNCVTGNDDACGLRSEVTWSSTPGQVYYILVHGFGSSTGNFDLNLSCVGPPANDDACDAELVTVGSTASFDNRFATAQAGEVDPGAGTGSSSCNSQDGWCSFETDVDNSIWYRFVAPSSGCVSIAATGSGFDGQLALYSVGNCNDFNTYTEVAANDDSGDDVIPGAYIFAPGIVEASCLTPGQIYYIQVDGFSGDATDNGTLHLIDCGTTPLTVDAGDCQTRFIGYAPVENDTNYLQACANGGFAPYTFSWSPSGLFQVDGSTCSDLAVQPGATTTYTVTVTDAKGCTATSTVDVQVIDLDCSSQGNGSKVNICHVPPGNPANEHNICVSVNAVPAHLDPNTGHSGDRLGPCGNTCLATNPPVAPPPACVDLTVTVTTDRFANETDWEIVDQTTNQVVGSASYTFADDEQTFSETFCVDPTHCYDVNIFDSFGDGICCSFGQGNWSVTFDGTTTNSPTGGDFGSSETISVGACGNKTTAPSAAASSMTQDINVVAYPNPSNGMANFKFSVPQSGNVYIALYSLDGKKAATIYNGSVEAGVSNTVDFNGSDLTNGIYVYKLVSESGVKSGKLQISK